MKAASLYELFITLLYYRLCPTLHVNTVEYCDVNKIVLSKHE
jgi:hypothetical protein